MAAASSLPIGGDSAVHRLQYKVICGPWLPTWSYNKELQYGRAVPRFFCFDVAVVISKLTIVRGHYYRYLPSPHSSYSSLCETRHNLSPSISSYSFYFWSVKKRKFEDEHTQKSTKMINTHTHHATRSYNYGEDKDFSVKWSRGQYPSNEDPILPALIFFSSRTSRTIHLLYLETRLSVVTRFLEGSWWNRKAKASFIDCNCRLRFPSSQRTRQSATLKLSSWGFLIMSYSFPCWRKWQQGPTELMS